MAACRVAGCVTDDPTHDARRERHNALRDRPLGPTLAAGAGVFFVALLAVHPAVVNLYGPFGEHAGRGLLVALVVAVVAALLVGGATHALARLSWWAPAVFLVLLVATTVVLFPATIDRLESFVPQPNERSSCVGFAFRSYPPGTMDASTDVYCVGLERPLPAG